MAVPSVTTIENVLTPSARLTVWALPLVTDVPSMVSVAVDALAVAVTVAVASALPTPTA